MAMRTSLIIIAAASLLLFPFAAGAVDTHTYDVPPVAQPLVREGDFAIKLAALYGLGAPANETEAEDLLSSAGVIPQNGWISDYPVTPDILGQLEEAAAKAASEGRLSMTAEQSTLLLRDLALQMGLPVPAGSGSRADGTTKAPEQPVIYNYYTGYGPPIITYYPPPSAYLYLYAWVPYPVWWYGYWYPGFYISNNFSTTIIVDSRRVFVRNRYVDPVTRRVVRIDPVVRTEGGTLRPLTILRTDDGRTFRNIREMRQGAGSGSAQDGGRGPLLNRPPGYGGYRSPGDRQSARDIYTNSIERQGAAGQSGRPGGGVVRGDERRRGPQGAAAPSVTPSPSVRPLTAPPVQDRRSRQGQGSVLRPAAPDTSSGRYLSAPPPRGEQGSVNSPQPSGRPSDNEDSGPGRNRR